MSINKVCISGNLGRDPELKTTQGGMQVCRFCVCVNDRKLNKQTNKWEDVPNWVDVTFFGNRAESIHQYLSKGMLVFVSGRLHQNTWEKDGHKRSKLEVIGDDIQFANSGQRHGQQQRQQAYQPSQAPQGYVAGQGAYQPALPQQEQVPADAYGEVYDEEIPF